MKTLKKLLIWFIPLSFLILGIACTKETPEDEGDGTEPQSQDEGDGTSTGTGTNTGTDDEISAEALARYEKFDIPSYEDDELDHAALAFPGAEGGGMYVTGGRGGTIYHVTTLEDNSNAGSLRYACSQSGARIVVFDVAGNIELTKKLQITNGDLTILGQTAPGDGICIAYDQVNIQASNIIVRYIHFRCSDYSGNSDLNDSADAFWGRYNENIIIDHCTMSWSIDECASFYANKNFTLQWCMLYEALDNSAYHDKSNHAYGAIWGGKNASFHHNLMANNRSRNARLDHPGIYSTYLETHRGNVDYRNNVIYNYESNSTYGGEDGYFNVVGNYYKSGPATSTKRKYYVDAYWDNGDSYEGDMRSTAYPVLYVDGNYNVDGVDSKYPNGIYYHSQTSDYGSDPDYTQLSSPLSIKADDATVCYVTTHSADDAFTAVLNYAGPSLSRDSADTRVATDAKNGTASLGDNGIIATMEGDNSYFPTLSGTASTDTDGDGMPDWFEDAFDLDPADYDASGYDLDPYGRYTNIEMYAHYLVKDIVAAQNADGTYTSLD